MASLAALLTLATAAHAWDSGDPYCFGCVGRNSQPPFFPKNERANTPSDVGQDGRTLSVRFGFASARP